MSLSLEIQGAAYLPGTAAPLLDRLDLLSDDQPQRAGVRLTGIPLLAEIAHELARLARLARPGMQAVRAILFDKNAEANWALGWHQDRTVAVRAKAETASFGPWSIKQGILHVEPPFEIISRMLTMRVHLDPVDGDNAPLLISPGTHLLGKIEETRIQDVAAANGTYACLADRGDVWLYSTPILHASAAAVRPRRRRVLQLDFSQDRLPEPLQWLGL